jgi:putative inorganic carbon (HCO3(-)) transporter
MIFYGLLAFFFLDYIRPTSFYPELAVLHLNSLVPLGVVIGCLLSGKQQRPIEGEPSNTAMVVTFVGLILFSGAFAQITDRSFNVFTMVLGYAFIYWALTQQVDSVERLKIVIKALLLVHLIVAALNPLMFTDPDVRHYVSSGAFLGDGNDFALSINIVVPLCLFLISESTKKPRKLFWTVALVVCLMCVVLTKSRGGTVALGCMAVYYWSKSERKVIGVAGLAVVVVLIVALAPPSYFERMAMIGDSQEGSAQGRIQAWTAAFEMAKASPLVGVSPGHFPMLHGLTAHSIYFLVLAELGFPGLIVLLLIIVRNLQANGRLLKQIAGDDTAGTERRLLVALNASMIAFAAGGAFLSAAYYPHMYVIAGLHTAARRIVHERSRPAATELAPVRKPIVFPYGISPEWNPERANQLNRQSAESLTK